MNFEIGFVNPKTNEEKKIVVELSPKQAAAAKEAPCLQTYIQTIAQDRRPQGFLFLGNGVRPVTLQ